MAVIVITVVIGSMIHETGSNHINGSGISSRIIHSLILQRIISSYCILPFPLTCTSCLGHADHKSATRFSPETYLHYNQVMQNVGSQISSSVINSLSISAVCICHPQMSILS